MFDRKDKEIKFFFKTSLVSFFIFLLSSCGGGGDNDSVSVSSIEALIIAPEFAKLKTDITISAAGSTSSGTHPLAYSWKIIEEPEASSGTIKSSTSRAAKLYATIEGVYKIKLTVSDGTSSDSTEKIIKIDLDGDGVLSDDDIDQDGDGVLNELDAFPQSVAEWVDSDGDGEGNYSQKDEDGDGVVDEFDGYPFDASESVIPIFQEVEFNGNLYPDGNTIGRTYPFRVSGSIESGSTYKVDIDYFLFSATAGDLISIVLQTKESSFKPSISLIDSAGSSLSTVKTFNLGAGSYAISSRIPLSGNYAFSVSELNNETSPSFVYTVDVFKDSDIDGLSDSKELAMGMINTNPDTDGDGLTDGLEFTIAINGLDSDFDGLPVWWDRDSDNDGIDDLIETASDVDSDGTPNFLDSDSDGDSIDDVVEFGLDPLVPNDTDSDGILDFVDLDDDSDGLLDVNDNDRVVKAKVSGLSETSDRLIVLSSYTEVAVSGERIESVARAGDDVTIIGEGFGNDPIVLWEHGGGLQNLKPSSSTDTELMVTVPKGVQGRGFLRVSNREKVSGFLNIKVVDESAPLIFSIETSGGGNYAIPGELLTISGQNFTGTSVNISFDGVAQTAQVVSDTKLSAVVPYEAPSGYVTVIGSEESNPVALEVRKETTGTVKLPSSSSVELTDLIVEFIGSSESNVGADGRFSLATRNQGPTSITIFSPERPNLPPAVFLSATVLSDQLEVELSPISTAVDLVYSAMGLEATIVKEDQEKVLKVIEAAVVKFGVFLNNKLSADEYYLENYQNDEFVAEYLSAIEEAGEAIDQEIAGGGIQKIDGTAKSGNLSFGVKKVSTGNAKVLPKENQEDYIVTLEKTGDSYKGTINVENDTMLFADLKATNAYNDAVIRDYVNGYFSSNLLGPQGGIFSLYWGSDTNVDLQYRSSNVVIYTPGLQGMKSWVDYYNSPSYKLAIRTLLSQAMVPVINTVVGVKFGDSTTNDVLSVLFNYGVFDGVENFWTDPSPSGFAGGVGLIIKKTLDYRVLQRLVKAVAKNLGPEVVSKAAAKLGLKLTPWGSAATVIEVGGTAIDLGKLSVDVGTTHSQIRYKVIFPISVEAVEPSVIIKNDEPKEVKLIGDGLGPIVRDSIFGGSVHYPSVEFTDNNGKSYIAEKPRYESYIIAPGSTPPRSPLKVTLPVDFLKVAKSPLSVKLHHHLVEEDLFSDDLVAVDLDTQYEINLVDNLTISSVAPHKGAWGDSLIVSGAGFSEIITDNTVYFTAADGGSIAATVTSATSTELITIVPKGAHTGDLWVAVKQSSETRDSNKLLFTLEQQSYTFTFGDNGSLNDDTFALYIDGQSIRTMPAPSRKEVVEFPLTHGKHIAELHGITAPDEIGTYYISFPEGISVDSGDPITGSDLTAGEVKKWVLGVGGVSNRSIKSPSSISPEIKWKE